MRTKQEEYFSLSSQDSIIIAALVVFLTEQLWEFSFSHFAFLKQREGTRCQARTQKVVFIEGAWEKEAKSYCCVLIGIVVRAIQT